MSGRGSVTTLAVVATLLGSPALGGCGGGEAVPSISKPAATRAAPAETALAESSHASASASASAISSAAVAPAVLGDILYVVKPNGQGPDEIWAMAADGSRPKRRLADHGWMPDLSPDGKTIAFTSDRAGDNMDIYAMNADGTGAARVTGNDFNGFHPRWSPDGATILFSGFPSEVYVVNRDGSGQKQLSANADMASWSPDGKRIVFTESHLFLMNADGSDRTQISDAADGIPAWSPDGKRIAFDSQRSGNGDIYVMDADGSNVVRLTKDPDHEEWPAWSPDGRSIVYSRKAATGALGDIWLMRADGSGQRDLTNSPADEEYGPSWR